MSVSPSTMNIEQLKVALRSIFARMLKDDTAPGGKPHYKQMYIEQVLARNEQYLNDYDHKFQTADSLRDMLKIAVNQGQMALHVSRLLSERPASSPSPEAWPDAPGPDDLQGQ